MENPWRLIPFEEYERHMSDASVGQTYMLDAIMKMQYASCTAHTVIIFGVGTGNGLRHIDPARTREVIGIDINADYLAVCKERYDHGAYPLRLITTDVDHASFTLPPADLIIANLFLEYVDLQHWISLIQQCLHSGTVLSVVLQRNNEAPFVSNTGNERLRLLAEYHHDVQPDEFIAAMKRNSLVCFFQEVYDLPGKKQFVRLDLRLEQHQR
jgi:hypothetical protein